MKWIIGLFVSFVVAGKINAQCDSTFFRYTATSLNGVSLANSSTIVGVGNNGYIIKSVDGGRSWTNKQSYTTSSLTAVQMTSENVGYSVGADLAVLKTEDRGESWFPLFVYTPPKTLPSYKLTDLFFLNKNKGFITGQSSTLLLTTDGGRSWKDTAFENTISSVAFANDSLGFVCGASTGLYRTKNGGASWEKLDIGFVGENKALTKVRFVNSTTGFVIGDGGICIKTTDGGNTWTSKNTPDASLSVDICFLNPIRGFVLSSHASFGTLFETSDGGDTWTRVSPGPSSYNCISKDPAGTKMIIAGGGITDYREYSGRTIVSTTDAGATYTPLSYNGPNSYQASFFVNDSTGYIGGGNGVLKTNDFGKSWRPLEPIPSALNGIIDILFLDDLHGFVGTDNIYKTNDGGRSWLKTTTPVTGQSYVYPLKVKFFDTLEGVVEDRSSIYKTTDGGNSWTTVLNPSSSSFTDLVFTGNGKGFAVGYPGILYTTNDKGSTWNSVNLNTQENFTTVYFYTSQTGYIGTTNNSLYKTVDGGNTWTKINTGIHDNPMRSLHFISENVGYMMCHIQQPAYSFIYKTMNGGLSWTIIQQAPEVLYSFGGFATTYITGDNGMILKTAQAEKPVTPGYIYGPAKACVFDNSAFVTASMAGVNLVWSLDDGGTNTYLNNKDTVVWKTAGLHMLSVTASNACGTSSARQTTIDVALFQPVITMKDSLLTVTKGLSYQWFLNSYPIADTLGGASDTIIATKSGTYTVQVKGFYGCTVTASVVIFEGQPVVVSLCPDGKSSISSSVYSSGYQWQVDTGTGYTNISDNSFYSGTSTSKLQLSNIPSSWYGYKFRCITNEGSSDVFQLRFTDQWVEANSGNWENPANWACGKVPDANTDVVVYYGTIIVNSNVTIRQLTLKGDAHVIVQPGYTLTVTH